jgi:zinc-ribbon family
VIIFGWRSLLKILGVGEFHCPRCQVDVGYELVRPRQWFTLFFIPVIPMSWGQTFVRCTRCRGTYRESVLAAPTNQQFGYMLAMGARAVYAQVVAAGFSHSEEALHRAVAALRPYTGDGYNEANLVADLQAFDGRDLAEFLTPLGQNMLLPGREELVASLVRFVAAEPGSHEHADAVISQAAAALQITTTHLAGIVALSARTAPEEH